jgi:hypothetical protein
MNPSFMITSMWSYGALVIVSAFTVQWNYILLGILPMFGFSFVKIRDTNHLQQLAAKVKDRAPVRDSIGRPLGYVMGWTYIGFIDQSENDGWIVCRSGRIKAFLEQTENTHIPIVDQPRLHPFTYMERFGNYIHFYYASRTFPSKVVDPTPNQMRILSALSDYAATHLSTVAYIHGDTGVGKTMLGPLLASKLGGTLCTTFNPSDPSDLLSRLYLEANASKNSPLIVVLDEVDTMLQRIKAGVHNERHPISVHDKSTWNQFLDSIDNGLYPHLILLLISNATPATIDAVDPSFIREGRVNFRFHLE